MQLPVGPKEGQAVERSRPYSSGAILLSLLVLTSSTLIRTHADDSAAADPSAPKEIELVRLSYQNY